MLELQIANLLPEVQAWQHLSHLQKPFKGKISFKFLWKWPLPVPELQEENLLHGVQACVAPTCKNVFPFKWPLQAGTAGAFQRTKSPPPPELLPKSPHQ